MMNWGQGIAAFLTIFVLFIGILVYKTTQSTFDLEAEDYYKQEIEFQDRIDAISLGKEVDPYLHIEVLEEDIRISLDNAEMLDTRTVKVEFFRANDSGLDRVYELDLGQGAQTIPRTDLVKGLYSVKFFWEGSKGATVVERELTID